MLNHQHKELICMIQLPPYRLGKLGIVMVPRSIPAVLCREPPWDQKKYHQLQSSESYLLNMMRTKILRNHPKPIPFSLINSMSWSTETKG